MTRHAARHRRAAWAKGFAAQRTLGDKDVAVVNDDYRRVRADRVAAIAAALDREPTA